MPQSMVHIENLVKRYGDLTALNHLELDIREGEIFGLLGPNGSGKTTAISCLLSLLKYDRGEIKIFGEEMKPDSYKLKEQIGIVLQNVAVFDELTVQENIDYFCGLYIRDRKRRKELVEDAIEFTGLEDFPRPAAIAVVDKKIQAVLPFTKIEHCLRDRPQAKTDHYG